MWETQRAELGQMRSQGALWEMEELAELWRESRAGWVEDVRGGPHMPRCVTRDPRCSFWSARTPRPAADGKPCFFPDDCVPLPGPAANSNQRPQHTSRKDWGRCARRLLAA